MDSYHASSGFMDSTMPLLGSWPITQLSTTSGFVSIGGIVLLPLWVNGCQLSHASWVHGFQIPHASSGSWIWLSTAHHGWQRGGRHIILLWYFFFVLLLCCFLLLVFLLPLFLFFLCFFVIFRQQVLRRRNFGFDVTSMSGIRSAIWAFVEHVLPFNWYDFVWT